jgi:uncharacterized protein with PIN domain
MKNANRSWTQIKCPKCNYKLEVKEKSIARGAPRCPNHNEELRPIERSTISEHIEELVRRCKPATQLALAEKTGVLQEDISRYITGQREPTSSQLIKLAKGAGVSADWLLGLR